MNNNREKRLRLEHSLPVHVGEPAQADVVWLVALHTTVVDPPRR